MTVLVLLLTSTLSAFAGDVPESILNGEDSQLFFGKVVYNEDNSEENSDKIELTVTKVIKGQLEETQVYSNADVYAVGDFVIETGQEYLIGYTDEFNPVWVMETTSQDLETLQIKGIDGNAMFKRLEKYLNNGEFEKTANDGGTVTENDVDKAASVENNATDKENETPNLMRYIVIGVVAIALISIIILIINKNRKK